MVDDDRSSIGQVHLFAVVASCDHIDGGGGVMDDVYASWRAGDKRAVEPLEILAHQPARKEVVGLDRTTAWVDHAPVAHPSVPTLDRPVIQAQSVARLVGLGLERVQRELPAWVVEEEVVGLRDVVHAGARRSGLDDVHGDVNAWPKLLARGGDHALEGADAPWS